MCGYLDYNWDECTEDEYNSLQDSEDVITRKEPFFKEGHGIMWQIEHYNDPPEGYKYYKARRDSHHYVFLCTSKTMEKVNKAIKDALLENATKN